MENASAQVGKQEWIRATLQWDQIEVARARLIGFLRDPDWNTAIIRFDPSPWLVERPDRSALPLYEQTLIQVTLDVVDSAGRKIGRRGT